MMDSEYERDKTIAEFTLDEVNRLEKERQALDEEYKNLNLLKNELSEKRTDLNRRIESLEEEKELVKSKELSEILADISELESEEALLAEKEKDMIAEGGAPAETVEKTEHTIAANVLDSMEKSIEMRRKEIDKLRSEIAEDEAQLAQQMSDIEAKRSKNVRNISRTVLLIVLLALVVTGILYIIGRRRRESAVK
jgi:chromosome segregation ATPase